MRKHIKNIFFITFMICSVFLCLSASSAAQGDREYLLGIKEGWAWPIIVIPPPSGWESPEGEAVKYACRLVEREISAKRSAIRGKEITFMFASPKTPQELPSRIKQWRSMNASVIVSFAGGEMDKALVNLCSTNGPCVIFSGGEDIKIKDPATGKLSPYLFALDFPYFAKANAFAAFVAQEKPFKQTAVVTDLNSKKLAKGSELCRQFLLDRGISCHPLTISGLVQDQFTSQVKEAESAGVSVLISWLDAMATLSIWRTAMLNRNGTVVYFAGDRQKFITDADGMILVDKDVLLERNEEEKHDIIIRIRDRFDKKIKEPVAAARAKAVAQWAALGYLNTTSTETKAIANALSNASGISLMSELLAIDSRTNRPKSRKYGVLRVQEEGFQTIGSVDVYSAEVRE